MEASGLQCFNRALYKTQSCQDYNYPASPKPFLVFPKERKYLGLDCGHNWIEGIVRFSAKESHEVLKAQRGPLHKGLGFDLFDSHGHVVTEIGGGMHWSRCKAVDIWMFGYKVYVWGCRDVSVWVLVYGHGEYV